MSLSAIYSFTVFAASPSRSRRDSCCFACFLVASRQIDSREVYQVADKDGAGAQHIHEYNRLAEVYSEEWYARAGDESLDAARIIVDHLRTFIHPQSVLDIGCGRGDWLKAWHEQGTRVLVGFDGHWNRQELMVEPSIRFEPIDLNKPFSIGRRFDLAMTLEVAEHLGTESSVGFVQSMIRASDLILFSAAYSHQGGQNHLNEQPHSYWGKLFASHGFAPFDIVRPVFWADDRLPFWYRQNSFLYARTGSDPFNRLLTQKVYPMAHVGFMDCIHPALYDAKIEQIERLSGR